MTEEVIEMIEFKELIKEKYKCSRGDNKEESKKVVGIINFKDIHIKSIKTIDKNHT